MLALIIGLKVNKMRNSENLCSLCFWSQLFDNEYVCNYPWDCSETEEPNVPPYCITVVNYNEKGDKK